MISLATDLRSAALALTLTLSLPMAAAAQGLPSSGTEAGPIEVFTQAEVIDSPFGPLVETTLIVENSSTSDVTVFLLAFFDWPDGSSSLLRYGPPVTVPAEGAVIMIATSLVPEGVGSGEGLFTGAAILGNIGPRHGLGGPLIALDQSPFVVP